MRRSAIIFLLVLLVAALFRAWLISTDAVAFESDEAIVALMARHINQGETIPTFFYGQPYMGSLDAMLVAAGFRILGESIHTMRFVEAILYLIAIGTGYGLAYEITRSRRTASMAMLILALPTMLGILYTSLALGGHVETVIWGNLILWLGWQLTQGHRDEDWRWLALGLVAGLGWWTYGAIVTPCAVVGLLMLRHFRWRRGYILAALAFLVGSSPWWLYNFRHDWLALRFLTSGYGAPPGVEPMSKGEALLGFVLLGLPAVYGLRFPWQVKFVTTPAALVVLLIYWLLLADALITIRRKRMSPSGWLIWLIFAVFGAIFTVASFPDATGRYLMPLWVPAAIGLAVGLDRLRRAGWGLAACGLGLLLAFQAALVIHAAYSPAGIQYQLVDRLEIRVQYDQPLIDFLAEQHYTRGYASYWTSYRIMFRSHEAIIFDTSLPYEHQGYGSSDNRYPRYQRLVAQADRVVWITQNFPELDDLIEKRLAERGITYRTRDFGPYHVYYDFSERVAPAELGLTSRQPIDKLSQE